MSIPVYNNNSYLYDEANNLDHLVTGLSNNTNLTVDGSGNITSSATPVGGVTSVGASSPLSSTGGATPSISVSSNIPLNLGGTNANLTAVNGGTVYSDASGMAISAAGTSGQVWTSNGAAAPTWQNASAGGVTTVGANVNPTANSASITGTTLNLAAGGATSRGVLYGWTDTTTTSNTFVGYNTPNYTVGGFACVGIGTSAIHSLTTGTANMGFGVNALNNVTSGTRNIAIGVNAGNVTTTGTDNICIGTDVINSANNTTFEYVFGSGRGGGVLVGNGSNTLTFDIGSVPVDTSTALMYINTTTGKITRAASSMRHKDPLPDPPLAQFVQCLDELKPRAFTFKNDPLKKPTVGYYAEEVEAIRGPLGKPVFGALLNYTEVDDTDQPQYPAMVMRVPEGELEPRLVEWMVYPKKRVVEGINYQGFVLPIICYQKWLNARLTQIEQHLGLTPPDPVN